jgi:hypothetical protein
MLMAVPHFLVHPLKLTVSIQSANLALIQSDSEALERSAEGSPVGHRCRKLHEPGRHNPWADRLPPSSLPFKRSLRLQQRLAKVVRGLAKGSHWRFAPKPGTRPLVLQLTRSFSLDSLDPSTYRFLAHRVGLSEFWSCLGVLRWFQASLGEFRPSFGCGLKPNGTDCKPDYKLGRGWRSWLADLHRLHRSFFFFIPVQLTPLVLQRLSQTIDMRTERTNDHFLPVAHSSWIAVEEERNRQLDAPGRGLPPTTLDDKTANREIEHHPPRPFVSTHPEEANSEPTGSSVSR